MGTDSVSDLQAWLTNPVTRDFIGKVTEARYNCDVDCHDALQRGDYGEAASYNSGIYTLDMVLDLPNQMMEDARAVNEGDAG